MTEIPSNRPRILILANQKGGVGKTTTAINLGTALAAVGERVLIFDLDPQGNASTGLGIDRRTREISSYDVLKGNARLDEAIRETGVPRLDIIPSTLDLLGFEMEVSRETDRAILLRKVFIAGNYGAATENEAQNSEQSSAPVTGVTSRYSYILIDCPPSLNLLTINAMAAGDAVLVPLQCEFFALEGLSQLLSTVEEVKGALNPALEIQGVVMTMYDSRNNLSGQVMADVRGFLGDKVYNTVIPRNVRISEAPSYGKPVLLYDHRCSGSQAYIKLASEIIQREREIFERNSRVPVSA